MKMFSAPPPPQPPAVHAQARPVYAALTSWAGYGWPSSVTSDSQFRIPSVNGNEPGAFAIWSGIGVGDPGIEQAGITVTVVGNGVVDYSAWYEDWPYAAVAFPAKKIAQSDVVAITVNRTGYDYTFVIHDETQGWEDTVTTAFGHTEPEAEAVVEDFGPVVPQFAHLEITTSGSNDTEYEMANAYPVPEASNAYDVLWRS